MVLLERERIIALRDRFPFVQNINLHIRHALTHALRENIEAWKSFFSSTDDVVERPKPPPGPWPFDEENKLLSIEDYLDQFITL